MEVQGLMSKVPRKAANPEVAHNPNWGGARKGAGRPHSGKNSETLFVRLPADIVQKVKARADVQGRTVSEFLLPLFIHEFRPRASRAGNKKKKATA